MGSVLTTKLVVEDSAFRAKMKRSGKSVHSYGKVTDKAAASTEKFGTKMGGLGSLAAGKFTDKIKTSVGALGSLGSGLLALGPGGLVIGAAVAGIAGISKVMDSFAAKGLAAAVGVDALAKTAGKLGFVTNEFAALKLGSTLSGVGDAAFDVGLRFFIRRVGELRLGMKEAVSAFAKVEEVSGIRQSVFLQKSTSEQLNIVAKSIAATADASEKLALAKLFGGDSGAELVPFFEALAKSTDGFRGALKGANAELSRFDVLMAAAIKDRQTFARLASDAQGIKGVFGRKALEQEFFRHKLAGNTFDDPTSFKAKILNPLDFLASKADAAPVRRRILEQVERERRAREMRGIVDFTFDNLPTDFRRLLPVFSSVQKFFGSAVGLARDTISTVSSRRLAKLRTEQLTAGKVFAEKLHAETRTPLERLKIQRDDLFEKFFATGSQITEDVFRRKLEGLDKSALSLQGAGKEKSPVEEVLNQVLGPSRKGILSTLQESIRQLQGGKRNVNEKILSAEEDQVSLQESMERSLDRLASKSTPLVFANF